VPVWSEAAPAKVNLHLHVVGRRTDGYHLLDSLVVFADIGDQLSISPAGSLSLAVTGPFAADLAPDPDNLVLRAAKALASEAGQPATGALVLQKNLPIASGIGGGSADAAATLRLLCRVWGIAPPASRLTAIAQALGADVPVCLASRPALMSGIGEQLAPARPLPDLGLLLVNPGVAVATQAVFRARATSFSAPADFPATGWPDIQSFIAALDETRNDLEPAARALAPQVGTVLDGLITTPGCLLARMSGSGATCFGLFASPSAAQQAAHSMARPGWWVWGGRMYPV
jgi:4-diphosphocytidyl-2-C-methyl-D-erythritol kinase